MLGERGRREVLDDRRSCDCRDIRRAEKGEERGSESGKKSESDQKMRSCGGDEKC